jgi:hypothetical protein
MTVHHDRGIASLEAELRHLYAEPPPMHLTDAIDRRVAAALTQPSSRHGRSARRTALLAASVALLAALAFAGGAAAQRVVSDAVVLIDGILFSEEVIGRPGLTNFGQPFWGTDILDRSPAEADAMAAAEGYSVRWQIEDRAGTTSDADDSLTFSEEPPPCGAVEGGGVTEAGRIQMVVVLNDPTTSGSACP